MIFHELKRNELDWFDESSWRRCALWCVRSWPLVDPRVNWVELEFSSTTACSSFHLEPMPWPTRSFASGLKFSDTSIFLQVTYRFMSIRWFWHSQLEMVTVGLTCMDRTVTYLLFTCHKVKAVPGLQGKVTQIRSLIQNTYGYQTAPSTSINDLTTHLMSKLAGKLVPKQSHILIVYLIKE